MSTVLRGSDNFDTAGGNAVKAWCNFNGTGTIAIRSSYNVSSITDNGVGDYTVNFAVALADANYSKLVLACANYGIRGGGMNTADGFGSTEVAPTTSAFRLITADQAATIFDAKYVNAVALH